MIEEKVEIRTADGTADGFLYRHEGGSRPGVIHLTDIGGIRSSQKAMASRLAAAGYTVLMPNLFYRFGKPPVINFAAGFEDEGVKKRLAELRGPLTPEAVESDAGAYVDFFAGQEGVSQGGLGVVGYCFAGSVALRAAAARPDRIAAAASFHGGGLPTLPPAPTCSCHASRPGSTSATRSRTAGCRPRRSSASTRPSPPGEAAPRARSTTAPATAGRCRTAPSSTAPRPSGLSRS